MQDISGYRFGFLTAIKFSHKEKGGKNLWEYKCDCGNTVVRRMNDVPDGKNQSCGCKKSEFNPMRSHGMNRTRFYRIWSGMKTRCNNKNVVYYKRYGGRGINCDVWRNFEDFKKDMFETYQEHVSKFGEKQTTIERIDNNGNYCKENCRWATYKEQGSNTRVNRRIKIGDKIKTSKEWSEYFNITPQAMFYRVQHGWYTD